MTQTVLAEILDYSSERQLQRIECGETACSVDKLMEIAQILDTSTDYLLFGTYKSEDGILERLFVGMSKAEKNLLINTIKTIKT